MDAVAAILRYELHQLLIDGIKYERIQGAGGEAEWEMLLFKDEGLIDYLSAERVTKSVYEYVVYESEVEREFAVQLDARDDIKLFVKLPRWFTVARRLERITRIGRSCDGTTRSCTWFVKQNPQEIF